MSKLKDSLKKSMQKSRENLTTKTAKIGGYSVFMSVVVLAIVIAVNVLVESLPKTITQFDISAAQLYSLTSASKAVVQNLDKDVTIYWISQSGEEDYAIEKLLNVYDSLSDKLTVVKKNPDVYPTFAAQYTDSTVYNNSLIVECGTRYRYIDVNDIYEYDTSSYYYTGSISSYFDGEGEITTALDYVISEDLPKVYFLTGHGESDISESLLTSLEKSNYETEEISLLNIDEIPEDADLLIINSPSSDISDTEAEMLIDYFNNGGHLLIFNGLKEDGLLENLSLVASEFGITTNDGVILENDRNYYAFQAPYILLPELNDHDITSAQIEENVYILAPIAQGLTLSSNSNATVTSLLDTSESSFLKAEGYALSSYEFDEENDTYGPFSVAAVAEGKSSEGKMVYVSTDYMLDEQYISYSSGANTDFIMNAVSWMIGETDRIAISSKSLDYNYLTITEASASTIKTCLIGIIPAIFLLYGITEVIKRRKLA